MFQEHPKTLPQHQNHGRKPEHPTYLAERTASARLQGCKPRPDVRRPLESVHGLLQGTEARLYLGASARSSAFRALQVA